jgi:dolichol-phosphate mannosyltransferase
MRALIIIPTYNERENIEKLLSLIFKQNKELHVLVVDDNSPDKTYEVVNRLQQQEYNGRLYLLKRSGKLGLGTAYVEGFKWALQREYDYVFEMDADFSHNPVYINDFLTNIKGNDIVLGSRYIKGGGVKNWGIFRRIISYGGSLYSRIILGINYRDLTGGFKCFTRNALEKIGLDTIKSNGYSFQIELTYRAHLKKMKIKEIPIIFEDRTIGKSKMSKKIFLEAILMVIKLRMNKKTILEE